MVLFNIVTRYSNMDALIQRSTHPRVGAWPLVITGDPTSLVHTRTSLYDALVALEMPVGGSAGGSNVSAALIQRAVELSDPSDIVMSATSCLCIWTEDQLQAHHLHLSWTPTWALNVRVNSKQYQEQYTSKNDNDHKNATQNRKN
jgi:hypothetical protein